MADALASGASVRKDVGVQVPPRAPFFRQYFAAASKSVLKQEVGPDCLQVQIDRHHPNNWSALASITRD